MRRLMVLLCLMLLLPGILPAWTHASQPLRDEAAIEAWYRQHTPQATFGYTWIVGSVFQPRLSTTAYGYAGGGCLYQASGDQAWFTADVQLPDGAEILGLRYYAYDDSAGADSELALVTYDGQGAVADVVNVYSEGSAGYGEFYAQLTTPFTVSTANQALAFLWQPSAAETGSALRICGARLFLRYPEPPAARATTYASYAASTFQRRESSITYAYGGAGCIYAPAGGTFTLDVNLPPGSVLQSASVSYYDNSANSIQAFVSTYDGLGNSSNLVQFASEGAAPAYRTTQLPISPTYTLDESQAGVVVSFLPGFDLDTRVCGMRLGYLPPVQTPTPPTTIQAAAGSAALLRPAPFYTGEDSARYRPFEAVRAPAGRVIQDLFIAGSTFQARDSQVAYVYRGAGCISATNSKDFFQADLQLPDGAFIEGVWHYYRDQSANDAVINVAFFDGRGDFSLLAQALSGATNANGYGATFGAAGYAVDLFEGGHALIWAPLVADPTLELCGARVVYAVLVPTPVYVPLLRK